MPRPAGRIGHALQKPAVQAPRAPGSKPRAVHPCRNMSVRQGPGLRRVGKELRRRWQHRPQRRQGQEFLRHRRASCAPQQHLHQAGHPHRRRLHPLSQGHADAGGPQLHHAHRTLSRRRAAGRQRAGHHAQAHVPLAKGHHSREGFCFHHGEQPVLRLQPCAPAEHRGPQRAAMQIHRIAAPRRLGQGQGRPDGQGGRFLRGQIADFLRGIRALQHHFAHSLQGEPHRRTAALRPPQSQGVQPKHLSSAGGQRHGQRRKHRACRPFAQGGQHAARLQRPILKRRARPAGNHAQPVGKGHGKALAQSVTHRLAPQDFLRAALLPGPGQAGSFVGSEGCCLLPGFLQHVPHRRGQSRVVLPFLQPAPQPRRQLSPEAWRIALQQAYFSLQPAERLAFPGIRGAFQPGHRAVPGKGHPMPQVHRRRARAVLPPGFQPQARQQRIFTLIGIALCQPRKAREALLGHQANHGLEPQQQPM